MTISCDILKIDDRDNVAVALTDLKARTTLNLEQLQITVREPIPKGHKIAIAAIEAGRPVIKYGCPIGNAIQSIGEGRWVHDHNLQSALTGVQSYTYQPQAAASDKEKRSRPLTFQGFLRPDGRAGVRNEIWIIPTVGCCNPIAETLARQAGAQLVRGGLEGVFHFAHPYGCSQLGGDLRNTQKILAGLVRHPNAGGVLVMGLGCENNQIQAFKQLLGDYDPKRIKFYNLQDVEDDMAHGMALLEELCASVQNDQRTPLGMEKLVIGLKCGGSDAFSGITANPLTGMVTDRIIHAGGSAILTEVPEMFGAESILMNRAADESVFQKTVTLINDFKTYFQQHNQPVYENPSPGNKDGGITTLEEKSLGCIRKGGNSRVRDVVDYGEPVKTKGLNLLNGPGNDIVSVTALAAAGAQIVLFSTGRGTPLGGPVPTIKIATNSELAQKKNNWIDFDAGQLLDAKKMDHLADELISTIIQIASRQKQAKNEMYNARQIAIFKNGVTL